MLLHCNALTSKFTSIQHYVCEQGGKIVLKEVNNHWSDNLIPSPNKKDIIFQHIKGPGLHSYVEQPNGEKKYVCSPQAECRPHQCHFMKNTTTALYKHFLQMYPLRRGKSCSTEWNMFSTQPFIIETLTLFICLIVGIVTLFLYRKLKPFFACKPSLL